MEDKELRKAISKYAEENDTTIIMLDFFDKSIIGISHSHCLIYDYDKMVEELMEDDNCSAEDAIDFIEYNTLRSIPYMEGNKPIVIMETRDTLLEKY